MTNRTVTGNLRVDQGSRLRESVFVSEAGILGPSAMQGEMTVLRGAAFANTITVSGVTQLLRDIRCSSFCALDDVNASQSLVAGNCTSLSSVEFGSNITIGGNLTSGTLTTSGSLTAGATSADSVSCTSLQASSASTQKATAQTVSLNGAASFTTDLSVNNIFAVSGDLNIGETLRAQVASATFTEDINVAKKMHDQRVCSI